MNSKNRKLRSGSLDLEYVDGNLRSIQSGGVEIVGLIYAAVRDRDWGTIPPRVTAQKIWKQKGGFLIEQEQEFTEGEIQFSAQSRIKAEGNIISFSFQGQAHTGFLKNRIGLCLHLPLFECRGKSFRTGHPDLSFSDSHFPSLISPDQPALDIRSLYWQPSEDMEATLTFKGEIFEMEDQRNWTDASYKVYGTPLQEPFPVLIEKGSSISQEIILEVKPGKHIRVPSGREAPLVIKLKTSFKDLPEIGVSRASAGSLTAQLAQKIQKIHLKQYSAEIRLFEDNWKELFQTICREADMLKLELELLLFFSENFEAELDAFLTSFTPLRQKIRRIIIFDRNHLSNDSLLAYAAPLIRAENPRVSIGGGSNAYFAELNRNRPDAKHLDFISYSICPQVHVTDDYSVMENVLAQRDTVESARELFHLPVEIHAISLKQRFNAVSTSGHEWAREFDPRQNKLFAALWAFRSIVRLIGSGVDALNIFETAGGFGLLEEGHHSEARSYPVFHLLEEFLFSPDLKYSAIHTDLKAMIEGIVVSDGLNRRLLLANYGEQARIISLEQPGQVWSLSILDGESGFTESVSATTEIRKEKVFRLNPMTLIGIDY